ncbi:hypothetical protein M4I21_17545 [Cellulophaga sp. 20_2_10]|uniref:hypothetical protein n=1 Tax=Cellulophaga sp. 20_2_10 TaxID=2942476 RepID=UPI00201AAF6B|nr:hypothetical protein [Cellulophaga sp. 20_2_10]MCL5247626.1 hypothetical protein [Cellulophaga sp. 20_2_10]
MNLKNLFADKANPVFVVFPLKASCNELFLFELAVSVYLTEFIVVLMPVFLGLTTKEIKGTFGSVSHSAVASQSGLGLLISSVSKSEIDVCAIRLDVNATIIISSTFLLKYLHGCELDNNLVYFKSD